MCVHYLISHFPRRFLTNQGNFYENCICLPPLRVRTLPRLIILTGINNAASIKGQSPRVYKVSSPSVRHLNDVKKAVKRLLLSNDWNLWMSRWPYLRPTFPISFSLVSNKREIPRSVHNRNDYVLAGVQCRAFRPPPPPDLKGDSEASVAMRKDFSWRHTRRKRYSRCPKNFN